MPFTKLSPFNDTTIRLIADRPVLRVRRPHRSQRTPAVACAIGLLAFVPVATFALELGEATVKSGLGESLLVQIPYRLAADERLTSACIGLAPAAPAADALPTYGRVSSISVTATHIEIFDDRIVREPLIGLNVDVHCGTAPRFVRNYQLFVDPPVQAPTILSNGVRVATAGQPSTSAAAAAPVTARTRDATRSMRSGTATTPVTSTTSTPRDSTASNSAASDSAVSTSIPRTARANASPRARGHAGGNLTQGQTYRVVRGDTLSGIASRIAERPTIHQTADAIFAANPKAFTRGNPDLIEEGRSITIPNMTPATATVRAQTPAALPAVRAAEPPAAAQAPATIVTTAPTSALVPSSTTQPTSALLPPGVTDASSVVLPAATESPSLPAVTAVAEPSAAPVAAATRIEPAAATPSQTTTGRSSSWLIPLLALGVLALLSAPLAFVRRRKQQAAAQASSKTEKVSSRRLIDPVGGIDVVEGRLSDVKPAATSRPKAEPATRSAAAVPAGVDIALTAGPTDSVDLDVGAPVMMNEGVDWFADLAGAAASKAIVVGDDTIEVNAATTRMPDLEAALTVRQKSPPAKPEGPSRPVEDDQMTLTIVELEALRQDYEAERTLTQQSSHALREAVADLKATQAAHAATAETSTLEIPQQPDADATDAENAPTARVRTR